MQPESSFKLILKSNTFLIPSNFPYLKDINARIITELLEKRQYEVKSDVSKEIFQFFINYLVEAQLPDIQNNNISEYEQLSQEFEIMKDLIKLIKMIQPNYALPPLTEIQQLDPIIDNSTGNERNEQIILNLFNIKGNNSEVQYKLLQSCKKENFKFYGILSQIEIKEENGILYILFQNNMTAAVFRNHSAKGDVTIPRTIQYKKFEFIVTSIIQSAFKNSISIETVKFSEDSELRIIGKNAFKNSNIYEISIPYHVTQICEGAFSECHNLEDIEIPKNSELKILEPRAFVNCSIEKISIPSSIEKLHENWLDELSYTEIKIIENEIQNIKYFEKVFIIGKSNLESDEYDVLLYASKNVHNFRIPKFIKRIAPYAFTNCNINKIEFEENSELQIIDKLAFFGCKIEKILIPSSVKKINDYAFCCELKEIEFSSDSQLESLGIRSIRSDSLDELTIPSKVKEINEYFFDSLSNLFAVYVMPNNPYFSFIDDMYLFGKSDPNSDIFDVLVFASRDIETARIPSFVKRIESFAFSECRNLKEITFSEDSKLESIGKSAFFATKLKSFSIPSHLKKIEDNAFAFCKIKKLEFSEDSELETICNDVFYESSIRSLSIPSHVVELGETWCKNIFKLNDISVMHDNKRYFYYNNSFIVGKSNIESEIYDLLVFAPKNIKKVIIPSFIKKICPFAFSECQELKTVTFEENSQLQSIENSAFYDCYIESIFIPPSVTFLGKKAFGTCHKLKKIKCDVNSELTVIQKGAFAHCSAYSFSVPPHVHFIGNNSFSSFKLIEINSELISLNLDAFHDRSYPNHEFILMVPANMKVF